VAEDRERAEAGGVGGDCRPEQAARLQVWWSCCDHRRDQVAPAGAEHVLARTLAVGGQSADREAAEELPSLASRRSAVARAGRIARRDEQRAFPVAQEFARGRVYRP
jgi:hypothetical protein